MAGNAEISRFLAMNIVNAPESVFNGDVAMIEFDVEWYDEVF